MAHRHPVSQPEADSRSRTGHRRGYAIRFAPLRAGRRSPYAVIGAAEGSTKFAWVSPEYFQTMAIPLIQGRGFTPHDTATSQRVALVNETFVRRYFGAAEATAPA